MTVGYHAFGISEVDDMSEESRRQFISFGAAIAWAASLDSVWAADATALTPSDATAASLIAPTHHLLSSLKAPALAPFLAEWPVAKGPPSDQRAVVPSTLPVLRYLSELKSDAPAFSRDLVNDISRAAPSMAWRRTYSEADVGAAFLQNYGWSEIVGTSGPLPSEQVACGFLVLGPQVHYRRHQHEAEEVYIPLVGTASWQQGDGGWSEYAPGKVIHHDRNEPHAMRTGKHPLLALYLWRSADLRQKAHFVG